MRRGTDRHADMDGQLSNDALSSCTVMACEGVRNLGNLGKLVGEHFPEVSWREACDDLEIRGSW